MEFIIRKATSEDLRQMAYIHVDTWKDTYSGIIERDVLSRLSYGKSQQNLKFALDKGSQSFFVAEKNDIIAGFAIGGVSRDEDLFYEGEIYAMYVLKDFQGSGIGKAFIRSFAEEFKKLNWFDFIIWCLMKNSACDFYRKMGGEFKETKKIQIGTKRLTEYGFVFETDTTIERLAE